MEQITSEPRRVELADVGAMMLAFEVDRGWYSIAVDRVAEVLDGEVADLVIPRLPRQLTGLLVRNDFAELLPLIDLRRALRLGHSGKGATDERYEALSDRIIVFESKGVRAGIRCDRVSAMSASELSRVTRSRSGVPAGPLPLLNLTRLLRAARLDPDSMQGPGSDEPERIIVTQLGELRVALDVGRQGKVASSHARGRDDEAPRLDLADWFKVGAVGEGDTGRKLFEVGWGKARTLLMLGSTVHIRQVASFYPMPRALAGPAEKAALLGVAVDTTGQQTIVADVDRLRVLAIKRKKNDAVKGPAAGRPS